MTDRTANKLADEIAYRTSIEARLEHTKARLERALERVEQAEQSEAWLRALLAVSRTETAEVRKAEMELIQNIPGPATCAALVKAQAAITPVEKGSTNTFHKYKYASGDDIIAEGRAALNANGLAAFATHWQLVETPFQWTDENGKAIDDVSIRLHVRYRLVHTAGEVMDFEPFSVPVLPEKGRPIDKAEAGARTYALSYFLRDLLLIPRVDEGTDVDQRDDSRHDPRRSTKQAPPRQALPAPAPSAALREAPRQEHREPSPAAAPSAKPEATPESARAAIAKAFPHAIVAEADAIIARNMPDAAKVSELRALYARAKDGPPPADSPARAEARRLIGLFAMEDALVRDSLAAELRDFSSGSGRVEDIGEGDLGAFVSVVSAIINGSEPKAAA